MTNSFRLNILQHTCATLLLGAAIPLSACESLPASMEDWMKAGSFTEGIEGPAVGPDGKLYVVNLHRQGTIGMVSGRNQAKVFIELPEGSIGNAIRFDQNGDMFIADYAGHNIYKVDSESGDLIATYHNSRMHQPNDIAVAASGIIYATDPDWSTGSGQLWRLDTSGEFTLLETGMGTTNGIELSPDGRQLYVNESVQRSVYVYDVSAEGDISNKRRLVQFDDHGLDGMKTDAEGNLYIARYGAGVIAVVSPEGEMICTIELQGQHPTNLAFYQGQSTRVFVTMQQRGAVETFTIE